MLRCTKYAAAFRAPATVEWFADASPKLQMTTASSGNEEWWSTLRERSSAKARPTALGRCDPMVEVCGMMERPG